MPVLATGAGAGASAAELRGRLRDRLVIERGTVWQEMVGRERRTAAARVVGGERGAVAWRAASAVRSPETSGGALWISAAAEMPSPPRRCAGGSGHGGQAARKLLLGPGPRRRPAAAGAASAAASRSGAACFGSATALAIAAATAAFFALLASPALPARARAAQLPRASGSCVGAVDDRGDPAVRDVDARARFGYWPARHGEPAPGPGDGPQAAALSERGGAAGVLGDDERR